MTQKRAKPWTLRAAITVGALAVISLLVLQGQRNPGPSTDGLLLSEETRESIWEAERRGTTLGQLGFPSLIDAINRNDKDAFLFELTEDCETGFPSPSDPDVDVSEVGLTARRMIQQDSAYLRGGPQLLADRLFELRAQLPTVTEAKFYTEIIAPLDLDAPDGAWSGRFKTRIWATADDGAHAEILFYSRIEFPNTTKEAFGAGSWISRWLVEKIAITQSPAPLFHDVATEAGFDVASLYDNWDMPQEKRAGNTGGVYLTDFNRDGRGDVLITDIGHPNRIVFYIAQEDGTFRDVTEDVGIVPGRAGMAAFIDIDNDGWEDLVHVWRKYIAFREWEPERHPAGVRVYRNLAGARYTDVTANSNLPQVIAALERANPPTGFAIADYDRDGRPDIYVNRSAGESKREGSWIDGESGPESANQLLRNVGNGLFVDVTSQIDGADGELRSTAASAWMDANSDGWPDLYVTDEFGDGLLLINDQDGGFTKREIVDQTHDWGTMGMIVGDYDNDGAMDIFVDNMYSKAGHRVMSNLPPGSYSEDVTRKLQRLVVGSELHKGVGDGTFQPIGKDLYVHAVGWSWGATFFDANNDGFLDLYANAGYISQDRSKPDG